MAKRKCSPSGKCSFDTFVQTVKNIFLAIWIVSVVTAACALILFSFRDAYRAIRKDYFIGCALSNPHVTSSREGVMAVADETEYAAESR